MILAFQKDANKEDNLEKEDMKRRSIVLAIVQGIVYEMDAVCSNQCESLEDPS